LVKDSLGTEARQAANACAAPDLNDLMGASPADWKALRRGVSWLLGTQSHSVSIPSSALVPMAETEMLLPARIGNFTDFYASVFHATNAGKLIRPENPLLPNYKYIPVAYHSRASSIRLSKTAVRRPRGQIKPLDAASPRLATSARLDYEAEFGIYVGTSSELGSPIPISEAGEHIFGFCLLNDWSARDLQVWEYQPLGPFLAKNFATTVSPWVVTANALLPFRCPAYQRPPGDPAPLAHLLIPEDQRLGGFDIGLETYLLTQRMRDEALPPHRLSKGHFSDTYWTVAQMIAHHTSNGCDLLAGDLIGSGTVSGPSPSNWGSLLELTLGGKEPLTLPSGETRRFLEDGDEVILRGDCVRDGYSRIGFGECRARILPVAVTD